MAEIKEFKNRMIKTAEVLSTQFDTVRALILLHRLWAEF